MHSNSFSTASSFACQILVYATEGNTRLRRTEQLQRAGFSLLQAESFSAVKERLLENDIAVCLVEAADGNRALVEFYTFIQEQKLNTQLVCIAPETESVGRMTIPAARYDILESNASPDRLRSVLFSAVERSRLLAENNQLKQQLINQAFSQIVSVSSTMQTLKAELEKAAREDQAVCLSGESGVEFNRLARAVHSLSSRGTQAFKVLNLGQLSIEQVEAALFSTAPDSLIQSTRGGTLLLNQIEALPHSLQSSLVRLIERSRNQDEQNSLTHLRIPRLICTLSESAETALAEKRLIPELHNLLCSRMIVVPALRQRREDLPLLAESFLSEISWQEGLPAQTLDSSAVHLIQTRFWLGNEAELRSVLYKACALNPGRHLTADLLEPWLGSEETEVEQVGLTLKEMERKLIETTFTRYGGNREKTAQALQIGLRTLSGKLREYGYPPRGGPGSNVQVTAQEEHKVTIPGASSIQPQEHRRVA
ncbi:MAG: sigma 54-interacting transcriptional regulator [Planctomycetaceae bacterium]